MLFAAVDKRKMEFTCYLLGRITVTWECEQLKVKPEIEVRTFVSFMSDFFTSAISFTTGTH